MLAEFLEWVFTPGFLFLTWSLIYFLCHRFRFRSERIRRLRCRENWLAEIQAEILEQRINEKDYAKLVQQQLSLAQKLDRKARLEHWHLLKRVRGKKVYVDPGSGIELAPSVFCFSTLEVHHPCREKLTHETLFLESNILYNPGDKACCEYYGGYLDFANWETVDGLIEGTLLVLERRLVSQGDCYG